MKPCKRKIYQKYSKVFTALFLCLEVGKNETRGNNVWIEFFGFYAVDCNIFHFYFLSFSFILEYLKHSYLWLKNVVPKICEKL